MASTSAASPRPRYGAGMKLVIIGAGGFGREVLDVIEAVNEVRAPAGMAGFEVLGFLDDGSPGLETLAPYGVSHLGPVDMLRSLDAEVGYVIGIGSPQIRRRLDESHRGRPCPALVHPAATVGRAVEIGEGSVICAGVRITNNIKIGRHVHLNINATVGHDTRLGDYVTVSPLVAVSGNVTLEDEVMLGTGATLNPGITVGTGAIIGSGAAALRDVAPGVTAVGVPAKAR